MLGSWKVGWQCGQAGKDYTFTRKYLCKWQEGAKSVISYLELPIDELEAAS
jgi:hypothetical protein